MSKRILSAFLALVFVILIVPVNAFAVSTISITFKDKNLYNGIANHGNLQYYIVSKDAKNKTIKFKKDEFNYIKFIDIGGEYPVVDLSGIEKFTYLDELYIGSTKLSKISTLSKLTKLKELGICSFSKSLADALGQLKTIKHLTITSTDLNALYGITNLTNLNILILDNIIYTDPSSTLVIMQDIDLTGIKKMTGLKELFVNGNYVYGISELPNLKNLRKLSISVNSDTSVDSIKKMTYLTALHLIIHPQVHVEDYQGLDISFLANFKNLTELSLSQDIIANNDFSVLSKLTQLTYLDLYKTGITDLSVLSNLTNLEFLDLDNNDISDISALKNLNKLEYFFCNSIYTYETYDFENIVPYPVYYVKNKSQTTSKITLQWDKMPNVNIKGFEVFKYDSSKKKYVKIASTKNNTYEVTGLKTATTYKFKVRAVRTVQGRDFPGPFSEVAELTTATAAPKISKITTGSKKANLTWGKITGATGYEIYMSTKKSSGYKKIKTITSAKSVKYTKASLNKNKTYYFKIRTYRTVKGKKVYSSYSPVKSIKIK